MPRPTLLFLLLAAAASGCGKASEPAAPSAAPTPAPARDPAPAPPATPWFVEITAERGIDATQHTGQRGEKHMPEIVAGGIAFFDADGDDDLDVYLLNGNDGLPAPSRDGAIVNRFLRQEADGRFVDATETSGLGDPGYGFGVAIGDVDNDGDVDVLVTNFGPDRLYRNDGDGRFTDVSEAAGMPTDGWSTSAALLDYDADGFLDIYICRYVDYVPTKRCADQAGRRDYCGPREFPPAADVLLRNRGDGTFEDASERAGIARVRAAGLGVVCDDFDDDGRIDVYVANDGYANQLWRNRGDGTFEDVAPLYGCDLNMYGVAEAGMGVVAADFDNSGTMDLFMTHLMNESNTLYLNHGGSRGFSDSTATANLGTSSMIYTGFGTVAFDADLDGRIDLFVANGRVYRDEPAPGNRLPEPMCWYAEPNLFYLNAGRRFDLVGAEAAALCAPVEITRGVAMGDVDRDGDMDLVLANLDGPVRLYRNDVPRRGRSVSVRAVDDALRRDAIGARVVVRCGDAAYSHTIASASSYLSASQLEAVFGVGERETYDAIDVRWPDGARERFPGGPTGSRIVLRRGTGAPLDGADEEHR